MQQVTPKKALGQHFLIDDGIAQQIVDSLQAPYPNVLEIGPGMGVLTRFLLQRPGIDFRVVEIDRESVAYLQQHFPELHDRILATDFLKLHLEEL